MKTRYMLIVLALCLQHSCTEPPHRIDEGRINNNKDKNAFDNISPLLSIEYPATNTQGHVPIYGYDSSTLLIRTSNPEDDTHCFAGVSVDEEKVVWTLPNLHSNHFFRADGYMKDNLFVVMGTNQQYEDPNNATLYCYDINTQTIVWSKDFWQYPRSWCGVVGHDEFCYHYENRIDDSLLIKTNIRTGESVVLYKTPSYYAPTGTNPTIATYGGNQYIVFYMWDLRKTNEEQNVVISVYNITDNKLTYQDYLPSIQVFGICISQPKDDVVYINHGHIMHCFNYVEGKIVWSKGGFDYDLVPELIVLDDGNVLRVAHAEMSYVNGKNGNVHWDIRYDETYNDYEGTFDFLPMWTFVHNNLIYQSYDANIIEVRDTQRGTFMGSIKYAKQSFMPNVLPLKGVDGYYVATSSKIIKFPYINY